MQRRVPDLAWKGQVAEMYLILIATLLSYFFCSLGCFVDDILTSVDVSRTGGYTNHADGRNAEIRVDAIAKEQGHDAEVGLPYICLSDYRRHPGCRVSSLAGNREVDARL